MIQNKKTTQGQTALILILLTAAALIFFAITLNWGRIAQTKALLTIAADQAATTLASDMASYGEMQKQSNLGNQNKISEQNGVLLAIIAVVIIVVVTILTWGTGTTPAIILAGEILSIAAGVAAVVNVVLQLVVLQPMITSLWNKLQKNQPVQQQFFEQGISTALQGAVGDQVTIADYLDWNANGVFDWNPNAVSGNNASGSPNDVVSRFAVFYSERLKMLNQPYIPQVVLFYKDLGAFINGETCAQNPGGLGCPSDCGTNPSDPACQANSGFELNDANSCPAADTQPYSPIGSGTINPSYNPYCDPCCQPVGVPDPAYCPPNSTTCKPDPLHANPNKSVRPASCTPSGQTPPAIPSQCYINNPYNSAPNMGVSGDSPYPLLYDPIYQNYNNKSNPSLLEQFGRDEQQIPLTVTSSGGVSSPYMTPMGGAFPNGVYPFFWLMKDYSPEVDKINPSANPLTPDQYHWCTIPTAPDLTKIEPPWPPNLPPLQPMYPPFGPFGFLDLNQLSLTYACTGADCCDNYLASQVANNIPAWNSCSVNPSIDKVTPGTSSSANIALDPSFGESQTTAPWQEGDNQMCTNPPGTVPTTPLYGWPYNASTDIFPDGTCEWTNSANQPVSQTPPANSTVDGLDDTMHTLSDFVNFSNTLLNEDVGTLSSTFDTWYPQAAQWIAPECLGIYAVCNNDDPLSEKLCDSLPRSTCNPGKNGVPMPGHLLSIYNPYASPPVDKFNDWAGPNGLITNWLANTYIGGWCVPAEGTLTASAQNEDTWINNNSRLGNGTVEGDTNWGDMPHVIACDAYNAGNAGVNPANNFLACYNALVNEGSVTNCGVTTTCNTSWGTSYGPPACNPALLGRSLTGVKEPPYSNSVNNIDPTKCPAAPPDGCTQTSAAGSTACPCPTTPGACPADPDAVTYTCPGTISASPDTVPSCPAGGVPGSVVTNTYTTTCPNCTTVSNGGCSVPCQLASCPNNEATCSTPIYTSYNACPPCSTYDIQQCGPPTVTTSQVGAYQSSSCDPTVPGSLANWAYNSYVLAQNEAPKFALREQFLQDIYSRAYNMAIEFSQADTVIKGFLKPCESAISCNQGGPAAQLVYARGLTTTTAILPNAVIYGWQDAPPTSGSGGCKDPTTNQRVGCSHIVKVTAYSPGRGGQYTVNGTGSTSSIFWDAVPYVRTHDAFLQRSYTLVERDGPVYVSVKRWDEDHSTSVSFPNTHPLWQFLFHNPTANTNTTGAGIIQACKAVLPPPGSTILQQPVGFGLEPNTLIGLKDVMSPQDQVSMGSAFMLDDEGTGTSSQGLPLTGQVDPNAVTYNAAYLSCLQQANQLLDTAPESHACVEYIASSNATYSPQNPSPDNGNDSHDYSLKFVSCDQLQDDLTYGE